MKTPLDCIEINPTQPAEACVLWLHGLGASGHDFEPLIPELHLVEEYRVRFVLPHAPDQAVTINQGYVMPAWYDIVAMDLTARQDEEGIQRSEQHLRKLMERELQRGIKPQRLFLAGFSQGGAIALHTALRYPHTLGGVLALSTYLPLADQVAQQINPAQQGLPVFIGHGEQDEVVPLDAARRSSERLQSLGCQVQWQTYAMAHSVCPQEVAAIRAWLVARLE